MPWTLRSAYTLTALWQYQRCSHINHSFDKAAPNVVDAGSGGGASFCSNENNTQKKRIPLLGRESTKERGKEKVSL